MTNENPITEVLYEPINRRVYVTYKDGLIVFVGGIEVFDALFAVADLAKKNLRLGGYAHLPKPWLESAYSASSSRNFPRDIKKHLSNAIPLVIPSQE